MSRPRPGFSLFDLLIIVALFALGFAMFLPAVGKARLESLKQASANNLRQIAIACHNYHDAIGHMPAGVDARGFSALTYLLPYVEQDNVFRLTDLKKDPTDKANAQTRAIVIKTFVNPLDSVPIVSRDSGPTNYLMSAGDQAELAKNNGIFYVGSKQQLQGIPDGTSNTILAGETLKGDSAVKATTVTRQHVALKADALKGLKPEAGVADWKDDKNIAADRGASWMDGKFLQTLFTGTRIVDDEKPDVDCGGKGGLSGLRSNGGSVWIVMGDGSTRRLSNKVELKVVQLLVNTSDGMPIPNF